MAWSSRVPHPTVLKYYVYRSTTNVGFTMPIFVLFLDNRGLTLAQIGLLESIWLASIILSELPTGYVADRLGQRNSVLIGTFIIAVSTAAFGLMSTFLGFALVRIVWSVGISLRSGSTQAWLYDTLEAKFDEEKYAHIEGRGNSLSLFVMAFTTLGGGIIAETVSFTAAFLTTAGVTLLAVLVVATFPTVRSQREEAGVDTDSDDDYTVLQAVSLIRETATDSRITWFVLYTGLFVIAAQTVQLWIQPVSVDVGLEIPSIGVMYAGFGIVSAGAAYFTGWVKKTITIRYWYLFVPPFVGALFVGVQLLPIAAVGVFFVMRAVKEISQPLMFQFLNDHIESTGRATLLSAANLVLGVIAIPMYWGTGVIGDATSPLMAIVAIGWIILVGVIALQGWRVLNRIQVYGAPERQAAD